jgi:diguanylate cyclase
VLVRLRDVIQAEIEVSGLPLSVEASIGYVVAPKDGSDIHDLLQLADVAMYVAKNDRSGVVRYHAAQNHYDASKLTLISELRHAIELDQLTLHYQPKVDLETGRATGAEALVRWQHPSEGLIYPDRFIPLIEQTDLIDELTLWVLRRALSDLAAFDSPGGDLGVAINVSARNVARVGFARQVLQALADAGVAPHRLTLELTETALMVDPVRAAATLREISRAGVRVSIDDFGTGQTSLGMLANLPIAELKIDRGFVTDVTANVTHAAIMRSIVELGHQLELRVVAEGVEDATTLGAVGSIGCDVVQGYHFARPMPLDGYVVWLDQTRERVDA